MKPSIDIALALAGASYNRADFEPLMSEPSVRFREVHTPSEWGNPDVVILPGSMDVAGDYDTLLLNGMAASILQHAVGGGWVIGICGGLQMMSARLLDPHHNKYPFDEKAMLNLLRLNTVFAPRVLVQRLWQVEAPGGFRLKGFEGHRGLCEGSEPVLFRRSDGSPVGYGHGRLWGTYLHRCFHNRPFLHYVLNAIRAQAETLPPATALPQRRRRAPDLPLPARLLPRVRL